MQVVGIFCEDLICPLLCTMSRNDAFVVSELSNNERCLSVVFLRIDTGVILIGDVIQANQYLVLLLHKGVSS